MSKVRRQILVAHQMLKDLVAIYAHNWVQAKRIQQEKTIGGRKLDLVGSISGGKLFVEVETSKLTPKYVEVFYEFCQNQKPQEAWRVGPEFIGETRVITQQPYCVFRIIPIKEIFDRLMNYYYEPKFEIIDGKLMLNFEPKT